jgi:hypothetical protein
MSKVRFFQPRNFEQMTQQTDLERLIAMNWYGKTFDPSGLAKDVMTAFYP